MEENKDLIILERQTKEKIAEIINTSNLPAFVLKSMMQDFFNQLNIIGEKQYLSNYFSVGENKILLDFFIIYLKNERRNL